MEHQLEQMDLHAALRSGLRRLAKAVVVITTSFEGARYAMAATAVSEVSMEPPSMLVCVNRTASLFRPLSAGANFCINILSEDQKPISLACSGPVKGEARFEQGDWAETTLGVPRLIGCQASFVCRNDVMHTFGTHGIFLGVVEEMFVGSEVRPLVYSDGTYGGFLPHQ